MESRCLNIFESACRTKATFKTFRNFLDTFLKWSNYDYESLLALQTIDLDNCQALCPNCHDRKSRTNLD